MSMDKAVWLECLTTFDNIEKSQGVRPRFICEQPQVKTFPGIWVAYRRGGVWLTRGSSQSLKNHVMALEQRDIWMRWETSVDSKLDVQWDKDGTILYNGQPHRFAG